MGRHSPNNFDEPIDIYIVTSEISFDHNMRDTEELARVWDGLGDRIRARLNEIERRKQEAI